MANIFGLPKLTLNMRPGQMAVGVMILKNRGAQDIFVACVDGLTSFPEAIEMFATLDCEKTGFQQITESSALQMPVDFSPMNHSAIPE